MNLPVHENRGSKVSSPVAATEQLHTCEAKHKTARARRHAAMPPRTSPRHATPTIWYVCIGQKQVAGTFLGAEVAGMVDSGAIAHPASRLVYTYNTPTALLQTPFPSGSKRLPAQRRAKKHDNTSYYMH